MDASKIYALTISIPPFLFLLLIILIAIPPKFTKTIIGWIAIVLAAICLGMYGYGYGYLLEHNRTEETLSVFTCILRTVFDSCRIFVGANNWSSIKDAYQGHPKFWECVAWAIQLLAMAISASAIIVSLGSRLLKKIRLWLLRIHDIAIIYGLDENTLEFGQDLLQRSKTAVLYLDNSNNISLQSRADQIGAAYRTDKDALNGTVRLLKGIGIRPGKRKLHIYALSKSYASNQQFAHKLMKSMERRGILSTQTALTVFSVSEDTDTCLQAIPGRYGYGSVHFINEPEMVARMLIRRHPPYKVLSFDKAGKATQDFHAVIIGFGQIGQAVLRQLIMNSQFSGSNCKISIFSPNFESRSGWISHECRAMMEHYDISMFPHDGRSCQLYDYLEENATSINYLVICAGSENSNTEIAERLQPFLERRHCSAPVLLCTASNVSHLSSTDHIQTYRIYNQEVLSSNKIDRMAMVINQSYCQQGNMLDNWIKCKYFERMSSRASADFYSAMLHIAGVTEEEAIHNWNPQGELLTNLAITEHMRWNAFHYCMGFRLMTDEEFQFRANAYLKEKATNPDVANNIRKDKAQRIHACLIPWENLKAYSEKESAITGEQIDYRDHDYNNVKALAEILVALRSTK